MENKPWHLGLFARGPLCLAILLSLFPSSSAASGPRLSEVDTHDQHTLLKHAIPSQGPNTVQNRQRELLQMTGMKEEAARTQQQGTHKAHRRHS